MKTRLAIFASGNGSNAEKILNYFQNHESIMVELILTNNKKAGVIEHAQAYQKSFEVVNNTELNTESFMIDLLLKNKIDYIVLAGFLKKIPGFLIQSFPDKILNIHPSLLPKYGGVGMYGHHVHEAVWLNKDSASGMTIHFVNEHYDEGNIIFQKECDISTCKNAEEIAATVLKLEWKYYATVIEKLVLDRTKTLDN